ncbi:MAG: PAS domain-containing sensor histidine kinase [Gallionella sp.]|nr:PAS domain-containing sensor histidine kinase [Gallionella sp.]
MIRTLFSTASRDAIVVMDEQGHVTEWNPAAQKMFQYRSEEVLGQPLHHLLVPARYHEEAARGLARFYESGEGAVIDKLTEMIARRKDGQEIPIELSISAVQVNDRWHAMGIIRDISEHKRVEAELNAAKEQAEAASKAKSEFLARVGHELLTPLNAVIGFAQVMEMSPDDETMGAHRESLSMITRSGWHLHRIIKELLNLSELDARQVELHIEPIDASRVIYECCAQIESLAGQHGITLHYTECGFEGVDVLADSFRLHEVLSKLLDNAIKYNRAGGMVTLAGLLMSDRLRILISDTGQGIPENELSTLFQPFSRLAQRSYSIEGGGVGLSIAKRLIGLMGGTIGVESVVGQGSTFWIELPIASPV